MIKQYTLKHKCKSTVLKTGNNAAHLSGFNREYKSDFMCWTRHIISKVTK